MNYKQITKNFHEKEFICKCCGKTSLDMDFICSLQNFRDFIDRPIIITNACRCWKHHVEIYKQRYGEQWQQYIPMSSGHLISNKNDDELFCCAIDFIVPGFSLAMTWRKLEEFSFDGFTGVGTYPHSNLPFIHIDKLVRYARWVRDENGIYHKII